MAAALAAGTHTNISVSYDDAGNAISLTGAQTYNDEMARDAIGAALTGGTGITVTPNDGADTITVAVDSTIASKTYADTAVSTGISNLIASAPSTLDTLNELAAALGNDASFSTTVTNAIAAKVAKAGDTMTGALTLSGAPTVDLHAATKKYVDDAKSAAESTASSALSTHESDTTNVHGITDTSKVVITDATQTLSNKTLTTPTVSSFENATHNHTNSAGGGQLTSSAISDFNTQVRTSKVTDLAAPTSSFSMNSQKITNLAEPVSDQDAATKSYVDAATAGLNVHDSVKAATTEHINISNGVEAGDVLDGVTLAHNNRILIKNQNTAAENGVYIVQPNGAATRATDYDTAGEVDAGDFIFVEGGTVNGKTGWVQTNTITTIGTDPIAFTQFSGSGTYVAGTGLSLTGSSFAIDSSVVTLNGTQTLTNKTITGTFSGNLTGNVTGDVSGNAGTVTNGVYTNGSYSNPSWLTALGWNKISSTPTTLSGYGITDAQALDADLTAIAGLTGTSGFLKKTAADTWSLDTNTYLTTSDASSTYLPLTGGTISSDLTITGNFTVNGTTTNLNSTNLVVEDKNIVIADVTTPTNITADGAGITIKGSTDKTFNWVAATTAFTSSEDLDLVSGKVLKIAGTQVLSASQYTGNAATVTNGVYTSGSYLNPSWLTSLAWSKISSTPTTLSGYGIIDGVSTGGSYSDPTWLTISKSFVGLGNVENTALSTWAGSTNLTTLGTIATGTWNATAISATKGGTGLTSYASGDILYASATNTLAKLAKGTDGQILTLASGIPSWAAAPSGFSAPTIGSTLISSGSTVTSISGLTLKDTSFTSITANTATTVDTNALAGFTTAKYVVSIKQGTKIRSSEVIVQTDGTSVDLTEFGITETGGTMTGVVVAAAVSSTNQILTVTITDASSTNATVKINKILI